VGRFIGPKGGEGGWLQKKSCVGVAAAGKEKEREERERKNKKKQ
jgi:hypothetical protein